MVQFNLLPEVKIEFIKARRQKHMISVIAIITGAICLGILIISLFVVLVAQPQLIKSADNKIQENSASIKKVPDINKVLTVQNQLGRLTTLHEEKPTVSRVFQYLSQTTPRDATLNKVLIDFANSTMTIGGQADTINIVRIYTDTLKLTDYQREGESTSTKAFKEVVLTNFSVTEEGSTFSISLKFDPTIFKDKETGLKLVVPPNAGASKDNVFTEDK